MNALVPLYREMAASGDQFHGLSILQHKAQIGKLIVRHGARKVLDFGCGRGDAYKSPHKVHRDWNLKWWDVTLYDPSFPTHDEKPGGKFDGVLCSDVLEHVEEADVDAFIEDLFTRASKFVWASVCCRPAKKCFPGTETNLHVTIHPVEWWDQKFADAAEKHAVAYYLVETP